MRWKAALQSYNGREHPQGRYLNFFLLCSGNELLNLVLGVPVKEVTCRSQGANLSRHPQAWRAWLSERVRPLLLSRTLKNFNVVSDLDLDCPITYGSTLTHRPI